MILIYIEVKIEEDKFSGRSWILNGVVWFLLIIIVAAIPCIMDITDLNCTKPIPSYLLILITFTMISWRIKLCCCLTVIVITVYTVVSVNVCEERPCLTPSQVRNSKAFILKYNSKSIS